MPKSQLNVREMIEKLTKTELLRLIDSSHSFWFRIYLSDILQAKAEVLQEKAEVAFREWSDFELPEYGKNIDTHLAYFKGVKEREVIFDKYEKLNKQARSLGDKAHKIWEEGHASNK